MLTHTFAPGSHIMSDRVNEILIGMNSDLLLEALPGDSVYGTLRDRLSPRAYAVSEFPNFEERF